MIEENINKKFEKGNRIEKFFYDKNTNILLRQIIDFNLKDFDSANYLFSITNKLSLKKRSQIKDKFFSFSLNLLDALFYLDLRFLQSLEAQNLINKKLVSKLLKWQYQPVLIILSFKNKDFFQFEKGLEKNEILLKNDWSLIKCNSLIIDKSILFADFLKFLNKINQQEKIIGEMDLKKNRFFFKSMENY